MSFEPVRHNFKIWKGATFTHRTVMYSGDVGSPPKDLSGYSALLEIKNKVEGTVLLTLNTSNGGIILGGTAGTIDLYITDEATAAITWKQGVYDLVITTPSGDSDAILTGRFTVQGV